MQRTQGADRRLSQPELEKLLKARKEEQAQQDAEQVSFFNPKTFNAVQPSSASHGKFDACAPTGWDKPQLFTNRFAQLKVADTLKEVSPLTDTGKSAVKKATNYVGTVCFNDQILGTAVLLNRDYLLVPRHCIEGFLVNKLRLDIAGNRIKCEGVVEEDKELDYAIVKITKIPQRVPSVKFADEVPNDTILLHHPLGKALSVSGHSRMPENMEHASVSDMVNVSHDSDSGSSGGAYLDADGNIVAIHLGLDLMSDSSSMSAAMGTGSAERYILPISSIKARADGSLLNDLAQAPQLQVCTTFLAPVDRTADWEREGLQSQLAFTNILKAKGIDLSTPAALATAGVTMTKRTKVVSFKDAATVTAIKTKYPTEMSQAIQVSLGRAGLHKNTNQYSIAGEIESDHPLPWDVWASTTNLTLKNVVTHGKGSRAGEDNMPAITIPYDKHRHLKSTGSSGISKQFRTDLTTKCNNGDVKGALEDVIQDYKDNDLLGATATDPKYKAGWLDVLDTYEAMTIISATEKTALIALL